MTRIGHDAGRVAACTGSWRPGNLRLSPFLRSAATLTAVVALLALPVAGLAAPSGGNVVAGAATIAQSGSTTTIDQSSNNAVINWQGFSIASKETVNFNQPSSLSATLNRVIGNEKSIISGALNANGRVFIVNSAGVLFTKGAQVNVGSLVASTLDIANADFMVGNFTFSGNSGAAVINEGRIYASAGGFVALLGKTVSNEGVISATLGTVALASGSKLTLNFGGDSLVDVTIDEGTLDALVENQQVIRADGGQVIMTASAADAVLSAQVNNSGIIEARTMAALTGGAEEQGSIKLYAAGGTTSVAGTLDASAPKGGDGGKIETSGNKVKIADSAVITTKAAKGKNGTWLVDPDGFTIAAGGGDITGAKLGSELASNNVTIASTSGSGADGDITVNDVITWMANTTLALNATNAININATITASGTNAGLVLNFGGFAVHGTAMGGTNYNINATNGASVSLSGANASLSINGNAYTLLNSMSDLAKINAASGTGFFALGQDIDALGSGTFHGAVVTSLSGTLAGLGHTIRNLTITDTAGNGRDGLVGTIPTNTAAVVRDIKLTNVNIGGASASIVGGLVGFISSSTTVTLSATISNAVVVGGTVTGVNDVGGLVGLNVGGTITDSSTNVTVTGRSTVGGLVGANTTLVNTGTRTNPTVTFSPIATISHSFAAGTVNATQGPQGQSSTNIGGLVGTNGGGTIVNSGVTGNVTTNNSILNVGGLVGDNTTTSAAGAPVATISNSFFSGTLTFTCSVCSSSSTGVGGLVGLSMGGVFNNDSVTGNVVVSATNGGFVEDVGGLVGLNQNSTTGVNKGTISNSVVTGNVTGGAEVFTVGGLVGSNAGSIASSQAHGNVEGQNTVGGLAGANSGSISDSTATGNVLGQSTVGGLVGSNSTGSTFVATITNSSASGSVTAKNLGFGGGGIGNGAGGLVGFNGAGTITNSSASGPVTGVDQVGGLVGFNAAPQSNQLGGTINGGSATGLVTATGPDVGGIAGVNGGKITNVIWNKTTTQQLNAVGSGSGSLINVTGIVNPPPLPPETTTVTEIQTAQSAARSADAIAADAASVALAGPPNPVLAAAAGTQATAAIAPPTLEANITFEGPATAGSGAQQDVTTGLGATINSIDVNGERYELQDESTKGSEPAK